MWQPACSHDAIKARAELYAQVRAFFFERNVLEVETPVLCRSGSTDPYLDSLRIQEEQTLFLQTSPEFAMKRLLASGSGDIYQICKSFRRNEAGARHNPEFTMLEWYREGWSLDELMTEIAILVSCVLGCSEPKTLSYKQAFLNVLGLDPFQASLSELHDNCKVRVGFEASELDRDGCLDLLVSHCIEPTLGFDSPCFLTDYPASQASLARIEKDANGDLVGKRAELYVQGIELANAYDELTDANEQARRFEEDQALRAALGLPDVHADENLVAALENGLPECAGVALGLDRLLMLKLGANTLSDVLAFPCDRA
jgi:elongation factor P--(R)-beta-lysine ligase